MDEKLKIMIEHLVVQQEEGEITKGDLNYLVKEVQKDVVLRLYDLMNEEGISFYDDKMGDEDDTITFNWVESKWFKEFE